MRCTVIALGSFDGVSAAVEPWAPGIPANATPEQVKVAGGFVLASLTTKPFSAGPPTVAFFPIGGGFRDARNR